MAASGSKLDIAKWITGSNPNSSRSSNVINAKTDVSSGDRRGVALSDVVNGEVTVRLDGSESSVVVKTDLDIGVGDRVFMTYSGNAYKILAFLRTAESITEVEQTVIDFSQTINESIGKLQSDISDLQVGTYFGKEDPTLTNYPYNEWTEPSKHKGDMFYNTESGKAFYFDGTNWQILEDQDIKEALAIASNAQDTADGKRTTFYSMDTPQPPYQVGDLWVSGANNTGDNAGELMVATATRRAEDPVQPDDWVKAVYYSDLLSDTEISLINYADGIRTSLEDQIDSKIQTWSGQYRPTNSNAPANLWTTTIDKQSHFGDLFYDMSTDYVYRWDGSTWQNISGSKIAQAVQDAQQALNYVEGVNTTYYQSSQPSTSLGLVKGDLWVNSSTKVLYIYSGSSWVVATKYTDDTVVNALINTIYVTNDRSSCKGYYRTYQQSSWTTCSTLNWWIFRPAYSSKQMPTLACCSATRSDFRNVTLQFGPSYQFGYQTRSTREFLLTIPNSFPFGNEGTLPGVFLDLSLDNEYVMINDTWRGQITAGGTTRNGVIATPVTPGVNIGGSWTFQGSWRINLFLYSRNQ